MRDDVRWTRDEIHYVPLPLCAYPENIYAIRYPLYAIRYMFSFWQTCGYFNTFLNKNQQKTAKKVLYKVLYKHVR